VTGFAYALDTPASVDAARLNKADRDATNWLSYGRTYDEQRFSPLTKITADNAQKLGLAWSADLDTNLGQQATPPLGIAVVPEPESRHRLATGALVLSKSILSGLHHEYSLGPTPAIA
jgi:hypothetical protein